MSKVWVVVTYEPDDDEGVVQGVFSTMQAAEDYLDWLMDEVLKEPAVGTCSVFVVDDPPRQLE